MLCLCGRLLNNLKSIPVNEKNKLNYNNKAKYL